MMHDPVGMRGLLVVHVAAGFGSFLLAPVALALLIAYAMKVTLVGSDAFMRTADMATFPTLKRIADAAVKYEVPLVKVTGGQRIDLVGVKKDDLPGIWNDIGMPAGYAWGKSYRTCKACIGTDFCRFGLGDSIGLALKIERRFRGIDSPGKLKLATAGCPRNCSEALIKDIGVVAIGDGKWEIYVGGAGGAHRSGARGRGPRDRRTCGDSIRAGSERPAARPRGARARARGGGGRRSNRRAA